MYQLAIEDTVEVPVKFTLKAGKVNKAFALTLTAKRLAQDEITERLTAVEFKFKEFMLTDGLITDWAGQRLVVDAGGEPAPFGPEALAIFLGAAGVAQVVFTAYQKECGAKEKN
jgi:hypothetical protein